LIDEAIAQQIRELEIDKIESLAESLLDFQDINDLYNWLKENT
jgi:Domain of unknown function (DUF4351)